MSRQGPGTVVASYGTTASVPGAKKLPATAGTAPEGETSAVGARRRGQFAHVVGCRNDEHAGVRVRQPAEERANDPTRRAAVCTRRGTHAAHGFFLVFLTP